MKLLGRGFMIIEGFFVGSVFNLVRGVQRNPLSAVFQVPTAQNNPYIKVACVGIVFLSFFRAFLEALPNNFVFIFGYS